MKKEELLKELEYINNVIRNLRPNDSDASFYYYQKYQIEEKLEKCEKNEKSN